MNYDTSMVKYYFLNSLFLRLFPAISVEELRIVALLSLCPPFGRSVSSDSVIKGLFSSLNASTLAESRPGIYSSFRESPVSDAQQVVGHVTGLHVISIERDARAAFTLWRYPSPRRLSSDGEVRKRLSPLVTDASPFTQTLATPKGLDAWQEVKDVVDSGGLFDIKLLSFVLILFSSQSQVQSIEEMNFVAQGFEQIPEPVIGPHGFNSDAERLGQGLDEFDDGSGAMVGDRNFSDRIGIGAGNGIGGRSGMQVNT
jgi:hypothetical protein